jgi:hypothetical protein
MSRRNAKHCERQGETTLPPQSEDKNCRTQFLFGFPQPYWPGNRYLPYPALSRKTRNLLWQVSESQKYCEQLFWHIVMQNVSSTSTEARRDQHVATPISCPVHLLGLAATWRPNLTTYLMSP